MLCNESASKLSIAAATSDTSLASFASYVPVRRQTNPDFLTAESQRTPASATKMAQKKKILTVLSMVLGVTSRLWENPARFPGGTLLFTPLRLPMRFWYQNTWN